MRQAESPQLVLASASTSRRALLESAGLRFEAVAAAVDEAAIKESCQAEGIPPAEAAIMLADAKAMRVARKRPEALVIGGDQLLVCRDEAGVLRWYDKPVDLAAARRQLLELRGRPHELVTATVAWRDGQRIWQDVTTPRLTMRDFSEDFLDAYLAAEGEVLLASVGAYRLEGLGVHLMARVDGAHSAILGLPLLPLLAFLRQHGVLTG
ncbi:Maf family protein [Falsiroseomonas tokyonensis]|uniref:Nucleoside triphosphate pyrophosphatase n=1 Tax=Falsiroseomonas tokyonensis TaxID=430521 RepID=A0ABV7BNT2_9PROT|nr:Maf family protein [Falsiroseomonas tokyonensis]MBU8536871.1 Maf family protein [Falsiroseomonas tokyonensis]